MLTVLHFLQLAANVPHDLDANAVLRTAPGCKCARRKRRRSRLLSLEAGLARVADRAALTAFFSGFSCVVKLTAWLLLSLPLAPPPLFPRLLPPRRRFFRNGCPSRARNFAVRSQLQHRYAQPLVQRATVKGTPSRRRSRVGPYLRGLLSISDSDASSCSFSAGFSFSSWISAAFPIT